MLLQNGCEHTIDHSKNVADEARRLARYFGENENRAEIAGWLHDVSAIIPPQQRLAAAMDFHVHILPAEEVFPLLLHQKLSKVIACDIFHISDDAILSAIECHTTLKPNASAFDKIIFVADKLKWDRPGIPPYQAALAVASRQSLDEAAFCYLEYLWKNRQTLKVLHPWAEQAYFQMLAKK